VKRFELGELVQQLDGDLLGLIGQDLLAPHRNLEHSTTDALNTSGAMEINRRPVDPVLVPGLRTTGELLLRVLLRDSQVARQLSEKKSQRVLSPVDTTLEQRQHERLKVWNGH
jgi:hypothetical protein